MTGSDVLARAYPAFFGPVRRGVVRVSGFEASDTVPDRSLIQDVNVVPFIDDRCVLVDVDDGRLTLSGGTRERENLYACAASVRSTRQLDHLSRRAFDAALPAP